MRTNIPLLLLFTICLLSCSRELPLPALSFDVTAQSTNLKAGEQAVFEFQGNPDVITFFSGEPGKKYENRNRISDTGTNVQLRFSTATTTATNGILSLLVSSDFSGDINASNIAKATWTDITARAKLATGTTTLASGDVSMTDFAAARKPVYIAFRYTAAAGSIQRRWTITGLTLNHILPEMNYVIANMTSVAPSPGWVGTDVKNPAVNWNASLVITGATSAASAVETEDWMVMGPVDLSRVFPDNGVPIKNISEGMNKFPFAHTYTSPGNYTAVFVAGNANRDASATVEKKISFVIN